MFRSETIAAGGVDVRLRRAGAGAPVLFLHGQDGLEDWPPFLDELARDHEVFVPDLPGFNGAPCPDWMDDVSDLAYLVLDLLETLDLRGVRIVAHALGGWVALEAAVRDPSRIGDLVLLAPAGIQVKGVPKTDVFMIDPEEQARLSYADPALGEAAAERALLVKHQDVAITNRIASARFGWSPRFHNPRLGRWLKRVRRPTLILWGAQDAIFPPAHGPAMQALLPSSTLVELPACGHLPHLERPRETLDAIRAWRGAGTP
ncbi:MAG TPA: alpha/beta fold hydrolase [Beijerinckiaceae bacterium]